MERRAGAPQVGQRPRQRRPRIGQQAETERRPDAGALRAEEWRRKMLGDAAPRPYRITYRKLTR